MLAICARFLVLSAFILLSTNKKKTKKTKKNEKQMVATDHLERFSCGVGVAEGVVGVSELKKDLGITGV